jgi:hypothetical protein
MRYFHQQAGEATEMKITTVGIDLAKNVFQVHGVDERGKAVLKKPLKSSTGVSKSSTGVSSNIPTVKQLRRQLARNILIETLSKSNDLTRFAVCFSGVVKAWAGSQSMRGVL